MIHSQVMMNGKCMYRNKKDDTALRDKIQDAMNAIGWNDKAKMDELMDQVLTQQPAAN